MCTEVFAVISEFPKGFVNIHVAVRNVNHTAGNIRAVVGCPFQVREQVGPNKTGVNGTGALLHTENMTCAQLYPDFAEKVAQVEQWWADHVDAGISPVFDEKKDAEILKALRTHNLTPDTDIDALIAEAEGLKTEVDKATAAIADKEKRLKEINDIIKEHAMKHYTQDDDFIVKTSELLTQICKEVTR